MTEERKGLKMLNPRHNLPPTTPTATILSRLPQPGRPDSTTLPLVEVFLVDPNPYEYLARTEIDWDRNRALIEEFAEGFKEGMMPNFALTLRPKPGVDGRYELVFGHLRLAGAKKAGISRLPAVIRAYSNEEMLTLMIKENEKRAEHSKVAQARQISFLKTNLRWDYQTIAKLYHNKTAESVRSLVYLSKAPAKLLQQVNYKDEYATVVIEAVKYQLSEEQMEQVSEMVEAGEEGGYSPSEVRVRVRELASQNRQSNAALATPNDPDTDKRFEVDESRAQESEFGNQFVAADPTPEPPARSIGSISSLSQSAPVITVPSSEDRYKIQEREEKAVLRELIEVTRRAIELARRDEVSDRYRDDLFELGECLQEKTLDSNLFE